MTDPGEEIWIVKSVNCRVYENKKWICESIYRFIFKFIRQTKSSIMIKGWELALQPKLLLTEGSSYIKNITKYERCSYSINIKKR